MTKPITKETFAEWAKRARSGIVYLDQAIQGEREGSFMRQSLMANPCIPALAARAGSIPAAGANHLITTIKNKWLKPLKYH